MSEATDRIRPLALWSLASARIFTDSPTTDFYLSLAPFFEPFIEDQHGELLNVEALKKYADAKLSLPLTDDVTEIFIAKFAQIGWIKTEIGADQVRVYRCQLPKKPIENETYNIGEKLDNILRSLRTFLSDNNIANIELSDSRLEASLLDFLTRKMGLETKSSHNEEDSADDNSQLDYWIAKFVANANLRDQSQFAFLRDVAGVALLAEALIEVRTPSQEPQQGERLTVFLDGPLLMDYMGLSGDRQKRNITYIVNKLKAVGASICCFRHSCDEIRDNLLGLLERAPLERTGPSADALRRKEVSEVFLTNVRNNVEYFVRKLVSVQVIPQKASQLRHASRYCDDNLYLRLTEKMPSARADARERDAESIAIIMRRRQGHETNDFFASKFVMLTGNESLVRRANELLREYKALGADRTLIGPAMHHRTVSGLLFANFGLTEKRETSQRQLLATCARVVMLRPKLVEHVRSQVAMMSRPEEAEVVDALLSQPRGVEVLMDYAVGHRRTISSSNINEVMALIKKTSADETIQQYEAKLAIERAEAKEREKDVDYARRSEREAANSRISELSAMVETLLAERETNRQREEKLELRRYNDAVNVSKDVFRRVNQTEKFARISGFIIAIPLFLVPIFVTSGPLYLSAGCVVAGLGIFGADSLLWNRQFLGVKDLFDRHAETLVRRELFRRNIYVENLRVSYSEGVVEIPSNFKEIEDEEAVDSGGKLNTPQEDKSSLKGKI